MTPSDPTGPCGNPMTGEREFEYDGSAAVCSCAPGPGAPATGGVHRYFWLDNHGSGTTGRSRRPRKKRLATLTSSGPP